MTNSDFLKEVSGSIDDIINTEFEYYVSDPKRVPSAEDGNLTLERGEKKKGKVVETCVLFVDIRDSVKLTNNHTPPTMGKVYMAFTKAVLKAAHHHKGFIRNIIGDRVMVVFPSEGCFTNAVDCAISINHIASEIINQKFRSVPFKCGIGIDYGKIRVIKVGQSKRGNERTENRGLVWVGKVANQASRLTDVANKQINKTSYEVNYYPWKLPDPSGYNAIFEMMRRTRLGLPKMGPSNSPYQDFPTTKSMTPEEFAEKIRITDEGKIGIEGGRYIKHEKKKSTISYKPILMTEQVYKGFAGENPNRWSVQNKKWIEQLPAIEGVNSKVLGGGITWET